MSSGVTSVAAWALWCGCAAACVRHEGAHPPTREAPLHVTWTNERDDAFVVPGDEARAYLTVRTDSDRTAPFALHVRMDGYDGRSTSWVERGEVRRDAPVRVPLRLSASSHGYQRIAYAVDGTADDRAGAVSIVYGRPNAPRAPDAGPIFGVSSRLFTVPEVTAEREVRAAQSLGVGLMRIDPEWSALQPAEHTWRWERLDATFEALARAHIAAQFLIAYGHPLTCKQATKERDGCSWIWRPAAPAMWRAHVGALAQRYAPRVWAWEVWNEPDSSQFFKGSTDDYLDMLAAAHEELHGVDPAARVMTGGFTALPEGHPLRALNPALQATVLRTACANFEILALHGHADWAAFEQNLARQIPEKQRTLQVARPFFINESGFASARGGDIHQAHTLVKKLSIALAAGSLGFNWYSLRDMGDDPNEVEHTMGLLRPDLSPKPSYAAYHAAIARLGGLRFERRVELGAAVHALAFRDDARRVIVTWFDRGSGSARVTLPAAEAQRGARVYDTMGNVLRVLDGSDETLEVGDAPVYVELGSAAR